MVVDGVDMRDEIVSEIERRESLLSNAEKETVVNEIDRRYVHSKVPLRHFETEDLIV